MMRMGLIVACLSTLTVVALVTPSRTKSNAPDPSDHLTVDVRVSPDTLEAADRIEIHQLQHEAPIQPISPTEPTPPAVTASVQEDSTVSVETIKRTWSKRQNPKDQRKSSRSSSVAQKRSMACSKHGLELGVARSPET